MPSGVSLRPQPSYPEALTTKAPAFKPPPSGPFLLVFRAQLSSGPQGRFLILMMPLETHKGPCPPEDQGASNLLVRRGAGARDQLGPG